MKKNNEKQDYTTSEVVIECCIVLTLQFTACGIVFTLIPASILGSIISILFILISNVASVTIADTITKIRRL